MRRNRLKAYRTPDQRHRFGVCIPATIALLLVLALTADVWALSSGGRYGGRAGFSQSRRGFEEGGSGGSTIPSRPYGGRAPGGRPSLNYPVPTPSLGYPLPVPIPVPGPGFGSTPYALPPMGWSAGSGGGFGLGRIFGLLIILGIVALVGKVLLQRLANSRRDRSGQPSAGSWDGERYAVVKCQLTLLATARTLQRELQHYAETATTNTLAGLASALQDAVMALMRYRAHWRYGTVQVQGAGTIDEAERAFNQAVNQERAKLAEELRVNIEGVRRQTPMQTDPKVDEVAQYLVVTLIVATGYAGFTAYPTPSYKDMEATLQRLGTLLTSDLLGLEVIWSPENPDDALTEDELVAEYPELSAL
jgi:uncharacterized membrane protein